MKPKQQKLAVAVLALTSMIMLVPGIIVAQDHADGVRKVLTRVIPQYPNLARTMNIRGVVRVDVLVAPNGTVKSLELKGGHPVLAQAAQDALRQWKWEPAPHESHEIVELRFNP
jgi:TonB family protein